MRLKLSLAGLALFAFCGPVMAGEGFVGASFGRGTFDTDAPEVDHDAWKVYGGYRFVKFFAIEAAYADLGTFPFRFEKVRINGGSVFAVGILPVGPVELFAKAGVAGWNPSEHEVLCGKTGCLGGDYSSQFGVAYGAGIAFHLRKFAIRAELEEFELGSVGNVQMGTVGVEWRFTPPDASTQARRASVDADGHVNFFIGRKALDSSDWEPVETQQEIGAIMSFGRSTWPIHIAVDVLASGTDAEHQRDSGTTFELAPGVRKIWTAGKAHPYVGGGVTLIYAEYDNRHSFEDADGTGIGPWVSGGIYWRLGNRFNIGFDVRWSSADVTFAFGTHEIEDVNAGGIHAGLTLGVGW